jgi:hypothetical protein
MKDGRRGKGAKVEATGWIGCCVCVGWAKLETPKRVLGRGQEAEGRVADEDCVDDDGRPSRYPPTDASHHHIIHDTAID